MCHVWQDEGFHECSRHNGLQQCDYFRPRDTAIFTPPWIHHNMSVSVQKTVAFYTPTEIFFRILFYSTLFAMILCYVHKMWVFLTDGCIDIDKISTLRYIPNVCCPKMRHFCWTGSFNWRTNFHKCTFVLIFPFFLVFEKV